MYPEVWTGSFINWRPKRWYRIAKCYAFERKLRFYCLLLIGHVCFSWLPNRPVRMRTTCLVLFFFGTGECETKSSANVQQRKKCLVYSWYFPLAINIKLILMKLSFLSKRIIYCDKVELFVGGTNYNLEALTHTLLHFYFKLSWKLFIYVLCKLPPRYML